MIATFLALVLAQEPTWTEISGPLLAKLQEEQKKIAWPGGTAGVAVDPASGTLFVVVPGQGLWSSGDQGATFSRVDGGLVGGRCETSFSLQVDPAGKRLGCFMLDGPCAMSPDGGKTWTKLAPLGRNWDYAAVDWSADPVKTIFGARHETGGEVFLSTDTGASWILLFKDPEFEKSGGLGIFDAQTLVYTMKGKGIQRSTDAGRTWTKIADVEPVGRVILVRKDRALWLGRDGMLESKDQGATWTRSGAAVEASIGPYMDPANPARLSVAGKAGIFGSTDGGATWTRVAGLPAGFSLPKPGWFANVAWDPVRNTYYASQMGKPAYRLDAGK